MKRWQPSYVTNHEAPPLRDLLPRELHKTARKGEFPLHIKNVGYIDLEIVASYIVRDETRVFFNRAIRWLTETGPYEEMYRRSSVMECRGVMQSRLAFPQQDMEKLKESKLRELAADEIPGKMFVRGMPRDEEAKKRRRILFEPFMNDVMRRDDLQYFRQSERDVLRRQVQERKFNLQFDFASYYDQFELKSNIQPYYCVRTTNAANQNKKLSSHSQLDVSNELAGSPTSGYTTFCLKNLPMGGRHSCEVAQAVTWAILDGICPKGVEVATIIDNVRFVSDDFELIKKVGDEFLRRCAKANATLNDADKTVSERILQLECFSGEVYDFASKTRCLPPKTVEKLKVASLVMAGVSEGKGITYRQFAAVNGLVMYATDVLAVPIIRIQNILKEYAGVMVETSHFLCPAHWDRKMTARLREGNAIATLLESLTMNLAVPVVSQLDSCELTLVTDASAWGWAALAIRHSDGSVVTSGGPWSDDDRRFGRLQSSVTAEPLGILKGVISSVDGGTRSARILTDHQPLVCAAQTKGRIVCEKYAECLARLDALYPTCTFVFAHVAGEVMGELGVDQASRGEQVVPPIYAEARNITERQYSKYVQPGWRVKQPWMV